MKMDNTRTHLSEDDIVRYRGRNMPPTELLAADSHLALCDICHSRMIEWPVLSEKVSGAARAFDHAVAREITHLTYEQLAALVDDQIDDIDREILKSHLDLCPPCETEFNDLREVRSRMATEEKETRQYAPTRESSLQERFRMFWRLPAFGLLALAVLAGVALTSFLISVPLRRENAEALARIAELERSNASLREQGSGVDNLQNELAGLRQENERLRGAAEAQALVALNDGGGRITLDTGGNLSGMQTGPGYEQAVKDALRTERVRLPASLREVRSQSGTLMGGAQTEFSVRAPVGIVIETDRPTFRWTALDGASSYTVTVYDANLSKVAESGPLMSTEWTLPSPLTRGRIYIWQVRATKEGQQVVAPSPAAGRAKFKVLEQSKVEQISLVKRSGSKSHLVLGLLYAEAGLLSEAEQEFNALLAANPDSSTARKLLQSVRQTRR
jgi:anti-sigma factor RsiW